MLLPGLPVLRAPRASAEERAAGKVLFEHTWQPHDPMAHGDGLGPVFNARSCVECHFQGGVGGGGDNPHNVLAFEAHPTRDRPEVKGGLIHKFAVENKYFEGRGSLREFFPIVPNGVRIDNGCYVLTLDFDPVRTETVNTTALFGAGWIDRISGKGILHDYRKRVLARLGRELQADFGGIGPGRPRVLPDGRVGKFGWKAQFATLEDFVAAACANEIGLGNPRMDQAKPWVRAGYPDVERDLDREQFRSLVAFVDTLPRPSEVLPDDPAGRAQAERGKALFGSIGCAACHRPEIDGVAGLYSDFLLHRLTDPGEGGYGGRKQSVEIPLPEEHPRPEEWKTPPLWGVADSAPYFHDGQSPTLKDAILRHHGDAEVVTETYRGLPNQDQEAILAFLKTLKAPADAAPVPPAPTPTRDLARADRSRR
ncbi:MAG: c-type cytochrome [Isosphaeraceae bacterium]|nr:c-type cytochrome [Isosphaeraceae bacterium]